MGCGGSKTKQPLPISILPVSNNAQSNSTNVENQPTAKVAVAAVSSSLENDPAKEEWTPLVLSECSTKRHLPLQSTQKEKSAQNAS